MSYWIKIGHREQSDTKKDKDQGGHIRRHAVFDGFVQTQDAARQIWEKSITQYSLAIDILTVKQTTTTLLTFFKGENDPGYGNGAEKKEWASQG